MRSGETVFDVTVPVPQAAGKRDIPVMIDGGFRPDGDPAGAHVKHVTSRHRDFRVSMVRGLEVWAAELLLPGMIDVWLRIEPDIRLRHERADAVLHADWLAAIHWLYAKDLGRHYEPGHRQEQLREAHCRAVTYTLEGEAGQVARSLVAQPWSGSVGELVATAQAVAD